MYGVDEACMRADTHRQAKHAQPHPYHPVYGEDTPFDSPLFTLSLPTFLSGYHGLQVPLKKGDSGGCLSRLR